MKNSTKIEDVTLVYNEASKTIEMHLPKNMDGFALVEFKKRNKKAIKEFKSQFNISTKPKKKPSRRKRAGVILMVLALSTVLADSTDEELIEFMQNISSVDEWNYRREALGKVRSTEWIGRYIDSGLINYSKIPRKNGGE